MFGGQVNSANQNNALMRPNNVSDTSENSDLIWVKDSNGNLIQVENKNPFPRLDGSSSNNIDSNSDLQAIKNGFWEGVGFINGAGDTLTYPFKHPLNMIEGFGETLLNAGKLAISF